MKIALVHDYLQEFGGAERVLIGLHQLYPQAPVYVAFVDPQALSGHWSLFSWWDLRPTFIQKIPFHQQLRSPLRIVAPHAFASLDLSEYDVVISSTNAYHAKAIRIRPDAVHLCYCHTPARSLYGFDTRSQWQEKPLTKWAGNITNHFLRQTDWQTAQQATAIIVNSQTVQKRVAKYWRRQSTVVHPPVLMVDTNKKPALPSHDRHYYLYVNRLNYAKHPELAVQVCLDLDLPLKVIGSGPMTESLSAMISKKSTHQIELLVSVSDEQLLTYYQGAKALLYPAVDEDFGIVPVEAMATGTPVIAHRSGGPMETIIAGKTGVFFDKLTPVALKTAIRQAEQMRFDHNAIQKHAGQFSQSVFSRKIKQLVDKYAKH